jgi:glycosyltransferase involved in cell wall biosynthesis/spore maturation protein CgeB
VIHVGSLPLTADGLAAHPEPRGRLRVAAIMDEFTESSFRPECQLLQLSVGGWQDELDAFRPELLFVESAWRGKDDQWNNKVYHTSPELRGVIAWCRAHGVPTVFWNKEDPVHFDGFLTTAKQFDWIFTTDIDSIPGYRAAVGHDRVHLLPFACQPATTNPIEVYPRKNAFCFAGAFYVRYPERARDLSQILKAISANWPVEIYDRYSGFDNPNYQFPDEYKPFIVGQLPFAEIDRAYKGYRYGINLNSVKQSQSMCARRVFELLASNTVTVSNFSRAVRMQFGDLVITSDNGDEIVRRLQAVEGDEATWRKFRLAGLRKVMQSHTYSDRLATIISKVKGTPAADLLPTIVATGYAASRRAFDSLVAGFARQSYARRRLVVVVPNGFSAKPATMESAVRVVPARMAAGLTCGEMAGEGELIAGMVAADYYGPNYLLDLALATRWSRASAIGKGSHYQWSAEAGCRLVQPGDRYCEVESVPARSSLVRAELVAAMPLADWVKGLPGRRIEGDGLLSVDEFNYCRDGAGTAFQTSHAEAVNDLRGLDEGLSVSQLLAHADRVASEPLASVPVAASTTPVRTGADLAALFTPPSGKGYSLEVSGNAWEVTSTLTADQIHYLHATTDVPLAELGFAERAQFRLDADPGLDLSLAVTFLDSGKQQLERVVREANREGDFAIPAGTAWIRFGIRLKGSGTSRIRSVRLGPPPPSQVRLLCRREHLVIVRQYPSYDDLYRFGFVHTRVAGYAKQGLPVDVFRLRNESGVLFQEYRNVDVITGSSADLQRLLEDGHHRSLLVHFLDEPLWNVLRHHVHTKKIFVWVHGFEIQPWYRRDFNNDADQQRRAAQKESTARIAFWRGLLEEMPSNLSLIFVSRMFAEQVMEDIGLRIPPQHYRVIHNPIDTTRFAYHPKPPEQRKKILSIASYASRKYANDLSVRAIQSLANKPWFGELEFRFVGDGLLFDEVLAPLRQFGNVVIDRRFLTPDELRDMYREYGVFLCPSRWDSQGVSRDEAMASGLVPVMNAVGAIPEFVNAECGVLAPPEDFLGLAAGIESLFLDETRFATMSLNASRRVRRQSDIDSIVAKEVMMFGVSQSVGRSGPFTAPWRTR